MPSSDTQPINPPAPEPAAAPVATDTHSADPAVPDASVPAPDQPIMPTDSSAGVLVPPETRPTAESVATEPVAAEPAAATVAEALSVSAEEPDIPVIATPEPEPVAEPAAPLPEPVNESATPAAEETPETRDENIPVEPGTKKAAPDCRPVSFLERLREYADSLLLSANRKRGEKIAENLAKIMAFARATQC